MPTRRSCVAQPFGLIKPSPTDGENTLKCINRMVRQTSLHTQREQLSCSSCTLSRGSRGVSPSSVTGGGIAMGTWASPPRIGGMVQADEVILQCNENLPIDDSLCLSPREEVQHSMLMRAPGSRMSGLPTSLQAPRSMNSHLSVTQFFALSSPSRGGAVLSPSRPQNDLDLALNTVMNMS